MKPSSVKVTPEAGAWPTPPVGNGVWEAPREDQRFDIQTRGPWSMVTKLRGVAISSKGEIFGIRSLDNPTESGYDMLGRVSIGGRRRRAFTSSKLFRHPDGKLVNVAVLYICD